MEISAIESESLRYAQITINKIVQRIDSEKQKSKINEAQTCDRFVLPFLDTFGWNPSYPYWFSQFKVENTRMHADYAFSRNGHGFVFVETKRIGIRNLDENKDCQEQISKYFSACPGAHLIILTNGEEYCFYSYGEETEIQQKPFIKFNIHKLNLTTDGTFLRHLFINKFNIGDWPKYADMSHTMSNIIYTLRNAPESRDKQHIVNKTFSLLYPELSEIERCEIIRFFEAYK